jgi:hypothetical protein
MRLSIFPERNARMATDAPYKPDLLAKHGLVDDRTLAKELDVPLNWIKAQKISEEDAIAEGVYPINAGPGPNKFTDGTHNAPTARGAYRELWGSINGWDSWDANPFVWAITFRRANHA